MRSVSRLWGQCRFRPYRNALRQPGSKLLGLYLSGRSPCIMSPVEFPKSTRMTDAHGFHDFISLMHLPYLLPNSLKEIVWPPKINNGGSNEGLFAFSCTDWSCSRPFRLVTRLSGRWYR